MTISTVGAFRAGFGKRPKTYGDDRICTHTGCQTVLSQYNKEKDCWKHAPPGRPRVRGKVPAEFMHEGSNIINHCELCSLQKSFSTKVLVSGVVHIKAENGRASCEEK